MSAIVAALDLRGDPLDPRVIERLVADIADRGTDGTSHATIGPIGLGCSTFATTPEAGSADQPIVIDHTVGLFDGRLDNRDELMGRLGLDARTERPLNDAALAVRAVQRWGRDAGRHLLGDFAVAVWDREQHQLVVIRDPLGQRPLFYCANGRLLVIGTELRTALGHPDLHAEPNVSMVAQVLARDFHDATSTLYRGVFRLPPAHWLQVDRSIIRTGRYWDVDPSAPTDRRSASELTEEFRAVFSDAVASRLRSNHPVTVSLSGGLDSSMIAGVAAHLARERDVELSLTSVVYPGSADESEHMAAVAKDLDLPWRRLPWTPMTAPELLDRSHRTRALPPSPNSTVERFVRSPIEPVVVLNGAGGDQWMQGTRSFPSTLARRGHLVAAASAAGLRPADWWSVLRGQTRRMRSRATALAFGRRLATPPLWLGPETSARWRTSEDPVPPAPPRSASWSDLYRTLHNPWEPYAFESWDQDVLPRAVESRAPFYDRRIVELMFAIPEATRWDGSDDRAFQRGAMAGFAPRSVIGRRDKGEYESVMQRQVSTLLHEGVLDESLSQRLGWVDVNAAIQATSRWPAWRRSILWWDLLSIELWAATL